MRRAHSSYPYQPIPTTSKHSLEEENDMMADELEGKIHALKSLSIDINTEVKYQDRLLRDMDEDTERSSGSLTATVSRVLRLSRGRHNCYILYIFLFSIGLFIFLWILLKFK